MTEHKSLARTEMFSDGVFAIAITLLILEIKVPSDSIHSKNDLVNALVNLWPSFFAFSYSFGGILVQWIVHHNKKILSKEEITQALGNYFGIKL